jgi:hypothetical protein
MIADERRELASSVQALRPRIVQVLRELADEGRHVAQLADPAEPGERGNRVVPQAFADDGERKVPRLGADLVGQVGKGCRGLGRRRLHPLCIGIRSDLPEF